MEWHFHYDGPVLAEDSRRCATCQAKALNECHTHGKAFADGCAHCAAAKGAPCQSHWGLRAALDAHSVEAGAEPDWAKAKALALAELEAKHEATYARVDLRGSDLLVGKASRREFVVDIFLR